MTDPDVEEIQRAYRDRGRRVDAGRYSLLNPGNLRNVQERERLLAAALRSHGVASLGTLEIMEIGSGSGNELARLVSMGATPANLYGVDLLPDAVRASAERVPAAHVAVGNAAQLEFPDARFDLVVQFTALSSMRSDRMRLDVAREMARVTRPGGLVVSYDFIRNPRNPDTVGIPQRELRRLFSGLAMEVHRVTLAPPLARRLPDRLAAIAALIPMLRTHLLAVMTVPPSDAFPKASRRAAVDARTRE